MQVLGQSGLKEDHHEREYIHCADVVRLLPPGQQLAGQRSVGTNLPQLPARAGSGGYNASAAVALDVVVKRTPASSCCEYIHGINSICILSTSNHIHIICERFSQSLKVWQPINSEGWALVDFSARAVPTTGGELAAWLAKQRSKGGLYTQP